ncbi:MAG: hypothetical protein BWY67_00132 [Bacteroidetes bacterium ADurb.Bin397]|nr:MAG: hypothetical protein BWY67_00132 [Bacteroidetes bacterium ADurb.Bin397]
MPHAGTLHPPQLVLFCQAVLVAPDQFKALELPIPHVELEKSSVKLPLVPLQFESASTRV